MFVWFDSLRPSQQFFSYIGTCQLVIQGRQLQYFSTDCEMPTLFIVREALASPFHRQGWGSNSPPPPLPPLPPPPPPPPHQYLNGFTRFTKTMSGDVKKRNSSINWKTVTHVTCIYDHKCTMTGCGHFGSHLGYLLLHKSHRRYWERVW